MLPNIKQSLHAPDVNLTTIKLDFNSFHNSVPVPSESSASSQNRNAAVHACILASALTKQAAELAFALKGRSMLASDVLEQIGAAVQIIYPKD